MLLRILKLHIYRHTRAGGIFHLEKRGAGWGIGMGTWRKLVLARMHRTRTRIQPWRPGLVRYFSFAATATTATHFTHNVQHILEEIISNK